MICTHCTYCSPAIYSTGTPHFAFHSTSILRCQLSSNLNTRIANYAAHISTQQNKTCQFQHTTTPSLYQQKHTTSPLSPKSSTPPHLFRPHLLPASPYSPSSAPTIAVKQQSVLARGRRSNRLGCSRLLDLGSFRFSYSGFPSLWCLGSTLALSLSLELSSVLVDLRLVRVIRRARSHQGRELRLVQRLRARQELVLEPVPRLSRCLFLRLVLVRPFLVFVSFVRF
jgi:hypothetical protein